MRKLQFLQTQLLPVIYLVLIFASWMSRLLFWFCSWVTDDKHRVRADFCLQLRSLGIFPLTPSPLRPPQCTSHPPQGKAALMFHRTLASQRDVGTECDTVVATSQENPWGPFRFSQTPEVFGEGNLCIAWGLGLPDFWFWNKRVVCFHCGHQETIETHLGRKLRAL